VEQSCAMGRVMGGIRRRKRRVKMKSEEGKPGSILELCVLIRTLHPFLQGVRMEAGNSSKTLAAIYQVTKWHIPRVLKRHQKLCENLNSQKSKVLVCLCTIHCYVPWLVQLVSAQKFKKQLQYGGMGNCITSLAELVFF
jgi:hypothetical protein